ncbi:iron-containing alcohol dehydrogenase family protein [Alkalicoccus chagannorensis]|uniref:iron-containing alcohol dehydrogenase family protein n=1 Tax=Alkalicoccus chagannorensis TaxID=427072 RepID=UPI000422012F|nr:iron-containing alcohol dehydrogenase family protein [Alkalicoccus chagannorensis]
MQIAIPTVLDIQYGALEKLEERCLEHGFRTLLLWCDAFTYTEVIPHLQWKHLYVQIEKIEDGKEVSQLAADAYDLASVDAMAACGGGGVIDQGKYAAFLRGLPFISIPTSASNDGFASTTCSLYQQGRRISVPAAVPYAVIADLDVIQHTPEEMLLSGVGDVMSNIPALYDWQFEADAGVGRVHAFAAMLSRNAVNSFIRTPMQDIRHPAFLKELVSALTMSGVSTVISGSTAPISGSEHLLSHALDQEAATPGRHGIQVGTAAYLMCLVHEHRSERLYKVFSRTGFFDWVRAHPLNREDWIRAVEAAPAIKPKRHTYLHEEAWRKKAIHLLETDAVLAELFTP